MINLIVPKIEVSGFTFWMYSSIFIKNKKHLAFYKDPARFEM